MNRSTALIGQAASLTAGSAGFCGRLERPVLGPGRPLLDPSPEHGDLLGRQRLAELLRAASACSGSWLSIRAISSLSSGLPGTIARSPLSSSAKAPSWVSSRRPALRALSSGPWQAKQWSERIGRTSRAKPTGRGLGWAVLGRSLRIGVAPPGPDAAQCEDQHRDPRTRTRSHIAFPLHFISFATRRRIRGRGFSVPAGVRLRAWSIVRDLRVMEIRCEIAGSGRESVRRDRPFGLAWRL